MNKIEFMNNLELYLEKAYGKLEKNEIGIVISDYEEYFREGKIEGKSEEEIVESLGNPKDIVDEIVKNDIEDGKYTQEDFLHYFYPNNDSEKDKGTIGDIIKDLDADKIKNGAYKAVNKAQKSVSGISKLAISVVLFFFDILYFPILIGLVLSFVGVSILGLMMLPMLSATMGIVGVFQLFIIFPAIFLVGLSGLVFIGSFYLFKLGIYINKFILRYIKEGRI